jgi:hypothetical protein
MSEENPYAPDKSRKEEILQDIKKVGESVGPRVSRDEYNKHGDYSDTTVREHFETFSDGLREAGLFPRSPNQSDVIRVINTLGEELGRPPMPSDIEKKGIYSLTTVRKRFDDYKTALIEAGYDESKIEEYYQKKVSRDELISEIQSISEKLGHPPNTAELRREAEYSVMTYLRRFNDDIIGVLKKTGFDEQEINRTSIEKQKANRMSNAELIDDIKRISAETGHGIDVKSLSEIGKYSVDTYYRRLGSLDKINELIDDD